MGRTLAEERYRQLRTVGRVEIPQTMSYFVASLFGVVAFTAIGTLFVYSSLAYADEWVRGFIHPATWIGLVCIGFFGVFGIPSIILQMFRRSTMTLTWAGIEEHAMKKGERVLTSFLSWSDIEKISGDYTGGRWPYKGQYLVFLHLRPTALENYRATMHPATRKATARNSRLFGWGDIALRRFSGGPKVMHELLDRALHDFGGPR